MIGLPHSKHGRHLCLWSYPAVAGSVWVPDSTGQRCGV
jgi:hypothetical protein